MLFVKLMSDEPMTDTDPFKHYIIVPVQPSEVLRFCDNPEYVPVAIPGSATSPAIPASPPDVCRFMLEVHSAEGGIESHPMTGNAYVMSQTGKTISTHGA